MVDKPHTFDAKLEHIRLQKHVYDLVRVQNLSVKDVMQKTGLSKVTIYRYLRTFVDENPKVAEQMRKAEHQSPRKTIRSFRKRMPVSIAN